MSAIIPANGRQRILDRLVEPNEDIAPADVQDPERLTRLLMRILRGLILLGRRFWPEWVEHEDREVDGTGTTLYRFPHGFDGRVRWWPTDWTGASGGPLLVRHEDTDDNTLVLVSYEAGTLTLRIEVAG